MLRLSDLRGKGWEDALGYRRRMHNGKQTLEHRLIMEIKLGRPLESHEVVDHINGIKNDNRPENLRLCQSNAENNRYRYGITPQDIETIKARIRAGYSMRACLKGTNAKGCGVVIRLKKAMSA